ncbi:unnamed protein product [Citrullus colocynthis]|uniref:Uncharacterized protein n=1 Tax=Citrullus colocynthis TaxID=252529 RepID=A0ABP0YZJ4_9ROSI
MAIMKFVIVPLVLIALTFRLCDSFVFKKKKLESEENLLHLYKRWSSHHRISRNGREMYNRFKVFKENAKYVFKVNQMNKTLKLKLNQFANMSNDEFMNLYTNSNITYYKNLHAKKTEAVNGGRVGGFMYEEARNLPSSIDWRKKGAVNDIKNQGDTFGSCWAFTAVAAIEGYTKSNPRSYALYQSKNWSIGMFTKNDYCGNQINHTVVVVGYGTEEDGTEYWIIRNSWGVHWGLKGYMKMQQGAEDPEGICGLAMSPSYPVKF